MGNSTTQQNLINQMVQQGVPISFINSHPEFKNGSWIDPQDVSKYVNLWNQEKGARDAETARQSAMDARTPDFLKNDPSWANLTYDQKEIAVYNYEIQKANDLEKAKALASALEQATAQADPYWKSIIRVAQDEVLRGVEAATGDYQSGYERLQRNIAELNSNLTANKAYLSLEQQAELASLSSDLTDQQQTFARNMEMLGVQKAYELQSAELDYSSQVDSINRNSEFSVEEKNAALSSLAQSFKVSKDQLVGSAAQAGLTFSTKRKLAEQRLGEQNQGLVESTMRTFNKTQADLAATKAAMTAQYGLNQENTETQYAAKEAQATQEMGTAERNIQEARDKTQRDYAKQISELEGSAASGNAEAQAQIVDLTRKMNESITAAGRSAETYLGTANLPALPNYNPLGNVTGQLYEDQLKDVTERKNTIYDELTSSSNLGLT